MFLPLEQSEVEVKLSVVGGRRIEFKANLVRIVRPNLKMNE